MSSDAMANVLAQLASLRDEVDGLKKPQLGRSSLENAALRVKDGDGALVGVFGRQYDDTYAAGVVGGPSVPTPAGLSVMAGRGMLFVRWTGEWADVLVAPMNFQRVEVHVDTDPNMSGLDYASLRLPTIETPRGGEIIVAGLEYETDYWIRLTARDQAGQFSVPSTPFGPIQIAKPVQEDLDIDWEAIGGNKIYGGDTAPVGDHKIGDLWLKTPENLPHRWEGTPTPEWTPHRDPGIAQALLDAFAANEAAESAGLAAIAAQGTADGAQGAAVAAQADADAAQSAADAVNTLANLAKSTADSKMAVYRQASEPTGLTAGDVNDLWIDSDDGKLYVWSGSAWTLSDDQRIATALSTATTANSTAASKTTVFAQTSQPSTAGRTIGDLWIDTDDENKQYSWNGSWTARQFGVAAISATARQLGAITTYRQATAPSSGMITGDFWIDSDDNVVHRYEGTWVRSQDLAVNTAITNAATAQATADGKMRIFPQASAPTGLVAGDVGDMWIDTDDGNKAYTWEDTGGAVYAWVARRLGNSAIEPNSLIASNVIATGTVTAALLESVLVLATTIIAGNPTGTHARMTPTGFRVYRTDTNGDGQPDEVIRLGTDTDDFFAISDGSDNLKASIDQNGYVSAAGATFEAWPQVNAVDHTGRGGSLLEILDRRPRGMVGYGARYTDSPIANTTAGTGIFDIDVTLHPRRMYAIRTSPLRVASTVGNEFVEVAIRYTFTSDGTTPAAPTLTSPLFARVHTTVDNASGSGVSIDKLFAFDGGLTAPRRYRLLLTVARVSGTGNVAIWGNSTNADVMEMWVDDIGPQLSNIQVVNAGGGGAQAAAPTRKSLTVQASWVRSYRQDGGVSFNGTAYQGYGDSFNGIQRSMIGFPDLTTTLAGATIEGVGLYLYAEHWYNNSGGTAMIGRHAFGSAPATFSSAGTLENVVNIQGWPKPGGRWVDLMPMLPSGWTNGNVRGILIGSLATGTSSVYYGRFSGGGANIPLLNITYTK